ncbi:phosphatidylinositol mannoside acyltransferase [Corynebacterium sp. HMSC05H05]|uniref:phosphatidylinositol mannoside acyltransferase n=1 Tax=Corynebacterium sp. HMSC05H05 TaxID=1581119 RepID=UPI0008A25748|nr:phosphatidylinositol mannoside acyltransferase [Corynebacterium sp. HMSC05H05]OFT58286.1 phosphatidylinositol mannoside acyltransferase [Corynebacterium sp. HMSC05H05]
MVSARERLVAAGYIAGWKIAGALPAPLTARATEWAADLVSGDGAGMDMLRRNLTRVVGPENVTRELVRDALRSYARYWLEAFRLPRMAGDPGLNSTLSAGVAGREHLDAAVARGRGVVLTLPHTGNWDMAGAWLAENYGGFTTVAERLKPEALFDAFVQFRESLGFDVVPLTGGEQPPFERLKEVLAAGGIVCLLGERDFSRNGVPVTFFGEETTFPVGPAKLSKDTGATLLVAHSWFTGTRRNPGWGFSISAPLEVTTLEETAQRVADQFAENIAAHPADWHMLQPLWPKDAPKPSRRREMEQRLRKHREQGR